MDNRSSSALSDRNTWKTGERITNLNQIVTRVFPDVHFTRPDLLARRVGGTTYSRVTLQAGQISVLGRRTPQHVTICQVLDGELVPTPRSGGQGTCGPGQICFWDASEPARVKATQNAVLLLTFVARDALGGIGANLRSAWELVHPPTVLSLSAARFIEGILEADGTPDPVTARLVEKLTHELVGAMLLSGRAVPMDTPDHYAETYARAIRLMTAQRTDPAITPMTIAADLHVSLRQLQREFSHKGSTIAGALRQLRAELAVGILRNPTYGELTISQVALHSGFTSAQQMRRVLVSCGYPTPGELRNSA